MGQLAAAEAQGDLHLVAFLEEAVHGLGLHVVVVAVDVGPELDLLDLDHLLTLARLGLLLLFLEPELAVVEDLADRRIGVRRDLDQVQPDFLGGLQSRGGGHDALLLSVLIDQQDAQRADVFVHAWAVLGRRCGHRATNSQALLDREWDGGHARTRIDPNGSIWPSRRP